MSLTIRVTVILSFLFYVHSSAGMGQRGSGSGGFLCGVMREEQRGETERSPRRSRPDRKVGSAEKDSGLNRTPNGTSSLSAVFPRKE